METGSRDISVADGKDRQTTEQPPCWQQIGDSALSGFSKTSQYWPCTFIPNYTTGTLASFQLCIKAAIIQLPSEWTQKSRGFAQQDQMDFQVGEGNTADSPCQSALEATAAQCNAAEGTTRSSSSTHFPPGMRGEQRELIIITSYVH